MVYTVKLKYKTFKQDLSDVDAMLNDQASTYAILRYAYDIPTKAYEAAMDEMASEVDSIHHRKLYLLIHDWKKARGVGLQDWEEEHVETIYYDTETGRILESGFAINTDTLNVDEALVW